MPISDVVRSRFQTTIERALDNNFTLSAYDDVKARMSGVINNIVCGQQADIAAFIDAFLNYSTPCCNVSDGNGGFDYELNAINDESVSALADEISSRIP